MFNFYLKRQLRSHYLEYTTIIVLQFAYAIILKAQKNTQKLKTLTKAAHVKI
ncbi:hypothetical protein ECPA22_1715 [Escherichia coli PA22]|nr:hypothetical protein ECPA22_1715 [Escherichia coli PA22]ERC66626.1 hypothetical protein ECBD561099_2837 [Escherichia coli Bd5610_99]